MPKTVVALFDDPNHAHLAVRELRDLGLGNADLSLVAADQAGEYGQALRPGEAGTNDGATTGAGAGALLGGLGGLLVGLGALAIPGIGPVIAAGPLATTLSGIVGAGVGAVAGGVAGGLVGALVDAGVPEEEAGYYAEGVRRGGTLLTVSAADDRADDARRVLDRHGAVDVRERARGWREQGWQGAEGGQAAATAERSAASTEWAAAEADDERRGRDLAEGLGNLSQMGTPPAWPVAFTDAETGFQGHHAATYGSRGRNYTYYRPAYEYGWTLRGEDRYRGYDWDRVEPEARRDWETRHRDTPWDDVRDAVRHAWERVTR